MKKMRIAYTSALLILCLSACGGAGNPALPGEQHVTAQRAAVGHGYSACCGTGSGTYTWTQGTNHCAGSVDSTARVNVLLDKEGKVTSNTSLVVTATFDSICQAWGKTGFLFYFDINNGTVSADKGVAIDATVTNGFCLPGTETGTATLTGPVDNAHLYVSKIVARCKDFDYSIDFGKVLIHDIPGLLH